MKNNLNISGCRDLRPYTRSEYFGRVLWTLVFPFFYFSPRIFFGWRRFLLRLFGAQIGKNVHVYPTSRIYLPWNLTLGNDVSIGESVIIYNLGPVYIGDRATVSQRAHLCAGTHDYQDPLLPLCRLPIEIGDQAWICADAFIGPKTVIGEGAIVGAASVVVKDVAPWHIVGGNPAKFLKMRTFLNKADFHN